MQATLHPQTSELFITATLAGRSASGSPVKRTGQLEGEQYTAPSAHPKRASRWVVEEAAEGIGQARRGQEASPSAAVGAPGDAVSDAEQPSSGSAQDSGEVEGDESPRRPVCVCCIVRG